MPELDVDIDILCRDGGMRRTAEEWRYARANGYVEAYKDDFRRWYYETFYGESQPETQYYSTREGLINNGNPFSYSEEGNAYYNPKKRGILAEAAVGSLAFAGGIIGGIALNNWFNRR